MKKTKKKAVKKKTVETAIRACSNFSTLKKLDDLMEIKSTHKRIKCSYCDKIHIDKFLREKSEVQNGEEETRRKKG